MASFLSRVGKSGALKEASTFLDTQRKDELAADVTRTKIGFLHKSDLRAEETERRAEQTFQNEQANVERENVRRSTKRNVKLSPMFLGLSQAGQQSALADLTSQGIINEEGVAEQGALEDFVKGIENNSKLFKKYMGPEVAQIEQSVLAINAQIQEEQEKDTPNPKKIEALQAKQKSAVERATLSRGNFEGHLNRLNATEKAEIAAGKKTQKSGANFLLPNGKIVLSFDGGRTYTDQGGVNRDTPAGTIKVPAGASLTEVRAGEAREQATEEIKEDAGKLTDIDVRKAASSTGPFASMRAAIDNIAGGLGIDKLFGKQGFFPENQKNRQQLRLVKQTAKSALLNSARGAVWEQQNIDKLFPDPDTFWVNPTTEAGKIDTMRAALISERTINNQAIITAIDPKETAKLRQSNIEIDRVLGIIREGSQVGGGNETIKVRLKSSGETGTIPPDEFDDNIYERL
ncbi:hypothetical protein LCGC14_0945590 [marine sediment metagenome]|uniref:Uncharacterized protein n=1 Tax=marine sediment metagenome TaxID=412755 RepID=A0A0F9P4W2_9ZZZZ